MHVADFDFELPEHLIAQRPVWPRDASRLLVHDRRSGAVQHRTFAELPELLAPGDLLVLNDTRVLPHRLVGRRPSGGRVEVLVLERTGADCRGYVKPARKVQIGVPIELEGGALVMTARERLGEGVCRFTLEAPGGGALGEVLERVGRAPLPPYLQRGAGSVGASSAAIETAGAGGAEAGGAGAGGAERGAAGSSGSSAGPDAEPDADRDADRDVDRRRYQTVYAAAPGAVAAPTAGLHFTPELLAALGARGVEQAFLTLHVGEGTFAPLRVDEVERHVMHEEVYELPQATAAAVAQARRRGGRIVAVGTTAARVLETCARDDRTVSAGAGRTRLFLYPGRPLRVVDALITNFHLPRSTLLMLVSAFAGREQVLALYREAIARGYRFYSFGDAMLIS